MMLEEEISNTRRLEKAHRMRKVWKKKKADWAGYQRMVDKMEELTIRD